MMKKALWEIVSLVAGVGIGLLVLLAMTIIYVGVERILGSMFLMTLVVSGTAVLVHNSGRARHSTITVGKHRRKE